MLFNNVQSFAVATILAAVAINANPSGRGGRESKQSGGSSKSPSKSDNQRSRNDIDRSDNDVNNQQARDKIVQSGQNERKNLPKVSNEPQAVSKKGSNGGSARQPETKPAVQQKENKSSGSRHNGSNSSRDLGKNSVSDRKEQKGRDARDQGKLDGVKDKLKEMRTSRDNAKKSSSTRKNAESAGKRENGLNSRLEKAKKRTGGKKGEIKGKSRKTERRKARTNKKGKKTVKGCRNGAKGNDKKVKELQQQRQKGQLTEEQFTDLMDIVNQEVQCTLDKKKKSNKKAKKPKNNNGKGKENGKGRNHTKNPKKDPKDKKEEKKKEKDEKKKEKEERKDEKKDNKPSIINGDGGNKVKQEVQKTQEVEDSKFQAGESSDSVELSAQSAEEQKGASPLTTGAAMGGGALIAAGLGALLFRRKNAQAKTFKDLLDKDTNNAMNPLYQDNGMQENPAFDGMNEQRTRMG